MSPGPHYFEAVRQALDEEQERREEVINRQIRVVLEHWTEDHVRDLRPVIDRFSRGLGWKSRRILSWFVSLAQKGWSRDQAQVIFEDRWRLEQSRVVPLDQRVAWDDWVFVELPTSSSGPRSEDPDQVLDPRDLEPEDDDQDDGPDTFLTRDHLWDLKP